MLQIFCSESSDNIIVGSFKYWLSEYMIGYRLALRGTVNAACSAFHKRSSDKQDTEINFLLTWSCTNGILP